MFVVAGVSLGIKSVTIIVKPSLAGRHTDPVIQGRPQAISVPKLLLTLFASLVAATA